MGVVVEYLRADNLKIVRLFFILLLMIFIGSNAIAGITKEKNKKKYFSSSVGNFVWLDSDRDGRQDPGEPGIPGVIVVLNDASGSIVTTIVTDSSGTYFFTGLNTDPVGKIYEILFRLPVGYRFSPKTGVISSAAMNSDADELSGKTGVFTLMPGQVNADIDAGMISNINGTLPLHLLELTATLNENKVSLKWIAENEMNTSQFIIQRSFDGIYYSDIGSKTVTSQINTLTKYSFVNDIQSLSSNGVIYYRIKAEDNIQRFAYSNIAPIRLSKIAGIRVWPSPFENDISISYNAISSGKADVDIADNTGRIVRQNVFEISRGINQLSISGVGQLPPGIYFIGITDRNTNQRLVQRLTK